MQAMLRALAFGLTLVLGGASWAAAIDDAKLAAAKRAADEFMRRAEPGRATGTLPRRSDPAVAVLLDTAFDNAALGTGVLPVTESGKIGELLASGNRVGISYLLAGTGASDFGTNDPKVLAKSDENVVAFAPEVGQWLDFQIGVQNTLAASTLDFIAKATPAVLDRPNVKSGLAQVRQGLAQSLQGFLSTMALAGLDDGWRRERLAALETIVDRAAQLVTPADGAALRSLAEEVAGLVKDAAVQAKLREFGQRIAAGKS